MSSIRRFRLLPVLLFIVSGIELILVILVIPQLNALINELELVKVKTNFYLFITFIPVTLQTLYGFILLKKTRYSDNDKLIATVLLIGGGFMYIYFFMTTVTYLINPLYNLKDYQ